MKILACGDLHITKKTPENRLDDYYQTILDKFGFLLKTAKEEGVELILQPGDLFDSPSVTYDVTGTISKMILNTIDSSDVQAFLSIVGQHDIWFHNRDNINTPHYMLRSSESIQVPNPCYSCKSVDVYGAPWESPIPEIETDSQFNVLLIHEMIVKNKKNLIWSGQEEYVESVNILRDHDFNLIISGDNHHGFTVKGKDKILINCGSMMRNTTSQADHKPFFCIIDTECPKEFITYHYPLRPFDDIMDMQKKDREADMNDKLTSFIEGLKKTDTADVDFQKIVKKLMDKEGVSDNTRTIIETIFDGE